MPILALRLVAFILAGLVLLAAPAAALDEECPEDRRVHLAGCVDLDTVMAADLQLSGAWIGAMNTDTTVARAHLTILNRGDTSDRLLGATSLAAMSVELVETQDGGNSVPLAEGVAIEPGDRVDLMPGGLRLELKNMDGRLRAGAEIEITLNFEHAGAAAVSFPVRYLPSAAAAR